ncbi:MAG: DUF4249 domain-containing protein [Bacteroidales bacterium]|nr:DUF4249 domain-containing protein [Bacteroidales bacterium]
MKKLIWEILILLNILSSGCKEEFQLSHTDTSSLFVVEGFITNESGPYTIKISKSSHVDDPQIYPITNCNITIYDNTGFYEQLTEQEPGIYITDQILGKVGNSYKISITTPDDKEYVSEFQKMIEPGEIDSIYAEIEYHESDGSSFQNPGYQFYINTKQSDISESYFLWTLNETYEYTVDFTVFDVTQVDDRNEEFIRDYTPLYRCWKTNDIKQIYTAETASLTNPLISNKALHFVNTNTKKLTHRYSLLVKQYTIDKTSYTFWKGIEDQLSGENFLFLTQPYNIKGGIVNVNDSTEIVLGHFTVASVNEKRIFVDRPEVSFSYEICWVILPKNDWGNAADEYGLVYLVKTHNDLVGSIKPHCLDCRFDGGEIKKPDYWID